MVNTTIEYRRALYTNPRFYGRATIELSNGHVLNLQDRENESAFLPDGIKVDDSVSTSGTFDIGAAIVNRLVMRLDNTTDAFSEYDFTDAVITAYVGLQLEGRIEWVKKGVFNAEDPKAIASILSIEAMDNMIKFDKVYDGGLTFPTTLQAIVLYCCNKCNVALVNSSFDNWDYVIRDNPFTEDNGIKTYRQIIMYCAQIAGCFARCNCDGMLELKWYDTSVFETMKSLDGGVFDSSTPYNTGDSFDGGDFSNYNSGGSFDGGTFLEQRKYHHLFALSSLEVSTDDVVITAIRVTAASGEDGEGNSVDGETAQYGQDGYVLHVRDNPFVEYGRAAEVAEHLGRKIVGMCFRKMNASGLGDPAIEAGDCAIVTDRKGNSYQCYLTGVTYTTGSYETFVTSAESPARNSAQRGSESTDVIVTARNEAEKVISSYDKVVQQMTQLIAAGFGMYFTPVEQDDGSTIFYMHDKPTIEESSYTCYMTSNGILASLDGGTTWAVDKYGNALYNVLTARGINADWINTGRFAVADQRGSVTFLVDCTTGEVRIVADSFVLRGKTIEELSQEANEAILDALAQDIQTQLDGKIETYNQTSDPSTAWTTTAAKQAHTGDLWYSSSTKLTKRWTGASWVTLDATDTVAQDLAKSKAKIFTSTPIPPYNVGDLWVQGESGDIMTCITARSSGAYVSADWKKRNKYTDDTYAKEVEDILAALGEDVYNQLDGKIETYSQTTDPSSAWTTAAIKSEHKGDLWYNTLTKLTKRWSGTAWVTLEATDTVAQELAQSKKRVFVTTPVPPYDVGDLWVGNSTSDMKRCQTSRTSGSYVSSDWIKAVKYTDDTVANSAFTLAEDAMNASTNPAQYLTQLDVFNKITDGGTLQGIYLQNGKIYINASYIQTGEFAADRIYGGTLKIGGYANQNGVFEVYNSSGTKVCTIDQNGVDVIQGKIGGFSLANGILTAINGYNTFEIHTDGAIKSKYKGGGSDQSLVIDDGQLKAYSGGEGSSTYTSIANGNITAKRNGTTKFISDATSTAVNQLFYLPIAYSNAITSTEYLVFGTGTDAHGFAGKVNRKSSSSRRYKDIGEDVEAAEVSGLYQLPVRFFKYKDGYLVDEDERNGVYMPGFIAEELEEILPIAVDHDENGNPEKWNTDIIIPCMMKMLQEQKEEFDIYKKETDERLAKLEKMVGGGNAWA